MTVIAQIRSLFTGPNGPLPATLPKALLLGVAAVVILPMLFCGRSPRQKESERPPLLTAPTEVSAAQLMQLRRDLERRMEWIKKENENLEKLKQEATAASELDSPPPSPRHYSGPTYTPAPPPVDDKRQEREERKTSNIAFSYRSTASVTTPPAVPAEKAVEKQPAVASSPPKATTYRIREGSLIETVLMNRLDGTFTGPVDCIVTTPVYSEDRQTLLIPPGARVLGRAEKVDRQGQERLAVVFHRLFLPDGTSYDLNKVPGLNSVGETGLRDQVNHHYGRLIGTSAALGLLGGLALSRTGYGPTSSGADLYAQGVASSSANTATQVLNRQLNLLPTITIREGQRVQVYLTQDIQLPAYEGILHKESHDQLQK